MIESEHEARIRDQEWELAQEELEEVAGSCTCEKLDLGSGGTTVIPH